MGKNAIVGQSGGPTAVINSSLAGVYETCLACGAQTVYGMRFGVEGLLKKKYVDLAAVLPTAMDVELLKRTPSSFLGSCRYKLPDWKTQPAVYEQLFEILKELDIGWFFYIGGNDSMDTICKLSAYGASVNSDIRFMGVPKTIDNDLMGTDHTPGYGSAAKYISSVIKEVTRDSLVYDIKSVTIVEIMGRNAGWLAAAAALAKGPDCEGADLIYLPEVAFDVDAFVEKVRVLQQTKPSIVIAVSEGIKLADGRYVCELTADDRAVDVFGHTMLTGTGRVLADLLSSRLGTKARAIELSTLQRCASHLASGADIAEAYQAGGAAVHAAAEGQTGKMVGLKRLADQPYLCVTDLLDIEKVANLEKKVPLEWIIEDGTQMSEAFLQYARPLIQTELPAMYVAGTPRHIHL